MIENPASKSHHRAEETNTHSCTRFNIHFNIIHLCLGPSSRSFLSGRPAKFLHAFLICSIRQLQAIIENV